jgi:cell division protein FtsI (penicillin-binding protein 3)
VHDSHPLGVVPLEGVLIHSSNIALAKIGLRLGADRLYEGVGAFGFGRKTGVGLAGESRGLVGPRAAWSPHTVISVPFGQELAVTPLQLATGYAALANGGLLFRPRLIDRLEDEHGGLLRAFPRCEPERVISADTSAWMRRTLLKVVEEGTGRKARVEGLAVCGKTGTSQKYERDPATGTMRVSSTKVIASFVGFAPADRPSLLCVVMWDEPETQRWGGSAAAPVVARILKRALCGTEIVGGPKGGGPRS